MHHPTVRLIPSAMFCLLLLFLAHDARAEAGVLVPPQRVIFAVEASGPVLTWWQASNADQVVLMNECARAGATAPRHEFLGEELGKPGWHRRPTLLEGALMSCLRLNEFFAGDVLGSYGPYPLLPWRQLIPQAFR